MSVSRVKVKNSASEADVIKQVIDAYSNGLDELGNLWQKFCFKLNLAKAKVINNTMMDTMVKQPSCVCKKKILSQVSSRKNFFSFCGVLKKYDKSKELAEKMIAAYKQVADDPISARGKAEKDVINAVGPSGAKRKVDEKTRSNITNVIAGGKIREDEMSENNKQQKEKITDLENENKELREQVEEKAGKVNTLENGYKENKELEEKYAALEKHMMEVTREKEELEKINRKLKKAGEDKENIIQHLKDEILDTKRDLEICKRQIQTLNQRPSHSRVEIVQIMQEERALERQMYGARERYFPPINPHNMLRSEPLGHRSFSK